MTDSPRIVDEEVVFRGWGKVTDYKLEMRPGAEALTREVYDHGNAAAILLYAPARGTVLLVRQFRVPALLGGDGGFLVEACAGLLEGDHPEACALKEAEEETGHRPKAATHVFDAYTSAGSLTEKVHCFVAEYDESTRVSAGGGLAHEGEEIEAVELPFETAFGMIAAGKIVDAKTIMLLQHTRIAGLCEPGPRGSTGSP